MMLYYCLISCYSPKQDVFAAGGWCRIILNNSMLISKLHNNLINGYCIECDLGVGVPYKKDGDAR